MMLKYKLTFFAIFDIIKSNNKVTFIKGRNQNELR